MHQCNKENSEIYKGRLEIKGICMNYTIKLLEGNMDSSLFVKSWKDDITGITHQQVFALGSVCSFPASLNEGDEFLFTIDPSPPRNCSVCLAYYPKPPKSIAIKVLNK
jgi:hypothetical protein